MFHFGAPFPRRGYFYALVPIWHMPGVRRPVFPFRSAYARHMPKFEYGTLCVSSCISAMGNQRSQPVGNFKRPTTS